MNIESGKYWDKATISHNGKPSENKDNVAWVLYCRDWKKVE